MNHKHNIEIIQQKISESHQIDPPEFIWDRIEEHLDKKQRRIPVWIWFIGLILSGIALFAYISNEDKPTVASNTSSKQSNPTFAIEANAQPVQNVPSSKANNNTIKASKSEENEQIQSRKNILGSNPTRTLLSVSNVNQKVASYTTDAFVFAGTQMLDHTKEISTLSTINWLQNEHNSTYCESIFKSKIAPKDDIVCHDFKIKKWPKYFIEPGLTLGSPIKSISGNAEYNQLLGLRRQTENAWYSWGAYLHVGMSFKNGLYAGLGVDYLQAKERFILVNEAITKMIINFDPQTGLPIDTSFVTGNLVNKGEIRYNTVDIPVLVGYLTHHKVWNFGAEVSARYNVYFDAQGKTYNQNLNISRIENEPNMYKSNIGWSGKASFIVSYNFGKSTQFLLKPYYWWQFNPINESNNPITTKWSGTGLEFGWRKIL
jgi:hypothetical protein